MEKVFWAELRVNSAGDSLATDPSRQVEWLLVWKLNLFADQLLPDQRINFLLARMSLSLLLPLTSWNPLTNEFIFSTNQISELNHTYFLIHPRAPIPSVCFPRKEDLYSHTTTRTRTTATTILGFIWFNYFRTIASELRRDGGRAPIPTMAKDDGNSSGSSFALHDLRLWYAFTFKFSTEIESKKFLGDVVAWCHSWCSKLADIGDLFMVVISILFLLPSEVHRIHFKKKHHRLNVLTSMYATETNVWWTS